ncbi:sulfatase [Marinilabilia rubra]|uniref:Sulfatase n=1 Tax=Marinilabilia rubra TaxID=2162893 RepID=A0A2U2B5X3_9BACT|nr:sulfatase [Marinilabilia rubra]PWD98433.1 sulfatase [Marinilabilia rubra]
MKLNLKNLILGIGLLAATSAFAQKKSNVLFIAVDDLKPVIGSYGDEFAQTPHIDQLAEGGTLFTNAHTQRAVCGPSRASLMTGMRPDYTGVWDLKTRMRDVNPDILTLPQYYKENGYASVAIGKIYDPRCVGNNYDAPSWSVPYSESARYTYPEKYGEPALSYYALPEAKERVDELRKEAQEKGVKNVSKYIREHFKPSTECADVEDDAYMDTQIANNALKYMEDLAGQDEPFFLAVGFKRPHLPFAAPKKYWDLYERDEVPLAEYQHAVKNGVDLAYHKHGELQSYTDIPEIDSFSDIFTKKLSEDKQRELIHGYYAAVSFIDAQVGRIMKRLKELGLDKNTTVVLWGDHGWHLGDHALWCKHTNFEQATRVPFIITTPKGKREVKYHHPVEFLDIFPTLCDISGLDIPEHLQGESLKPVLSDPDTRIKEYAVSQFSRGKTNGYSIRTDRYRLTLWLENDYRTFDPLDENLIVAGELYDYQEDPLETENFYEDREYLEVRDRLMDYFREFVKQQNQELKGAGSIPQGKETNTTGEARMKKKASADPEGISFDQTFRQNWKIIARNGAKVAFDTKNGRLKATVDKLGENNWDIQVQTKEPLYFREGQKLILKLEAKGGNIKFACGPVNGERVVRKIKTGNQLQSEKLYFPFPETGEWDFKIQFLDKGDYEIRILDVKVK